jgi:hypothetical protein
MQRIFLAVRAFFRILGSAAVAQQVDSVLRGAAVAAGPAAAPAAIPQRPAKKPAAAKPQRSDAITLLATLQREARLVDFVKESLDGYSDAQVGAASRDVHRGCGEVLERLFALRSLLPEQENQTVEVARDFDPGCYQLTGNVTGDSQFQGKLVHHGWHATICKLAAWSGSKAAAQVVAPAEVELP